MYRYIKRRRKFIIEGNEVLRAVISYPEVEGCETVSNFYADIADRCERWCEEVCLPHISQSATEVIRPSAPCPTYRFCAEVTECSEELISITLTVSLTRGRSELSKNYSDTQTWDLRYQLLKKHK